MHSEKIGTLDAAEQNRRLATRGPEKIFILTTVMPSTHCRLYCRSFEGKDAGAIRKFLVVELKLVTIKSRPAWVTKRMGDRTATVRFTDEVSLDNIEALTSCKVIFDGQPVKCDLVSSSPEDDTKRQKTDKELSPEALITSHVLPMINESYSDQLENKRKDVVAALSEALKLVHASAKTRSYTPLPKWESLKIDETISGLSEGYRNKCEFTIGSDLEGTPEVGFILRRATSSSEPVIVAGETLIHVSSQIRDIIISFRSILIKLIPEGFPLFSHITKQGCWRMIMVRACPITGESQVIVQCGPQPNSLLESSLISWAKSVSITSLFVQYNSGFTDTTAVSESNEMKLLNGPESIHMGIKTSTDHIVKYLVNPLSFFQTNTLGCSSLYSRVASLIPSSSNQPRVIFDVCCGVGSIGIFLAASLGASIQRIVGIDIVPEAVANAQANASLNELANCSYIAGRAESVMESVTKSAATDSATEYICIVDPPRVGLHKSVIRAIRDCEAIKTVVYVSCNPKSLSVDLAKFCEPLTSSPDEEGIAVNHRFVPTSAVAVDMFPHTPHCEVVVKLERP